MRAPSATRVFAWTLVALCANCFAGQLQPPSPADSAAAEAAARAARSAGARKWLEQDVFRIYIPNSDFVYRTYPRDGFTYMTGWVSDCAYDFALNAIRRIPTTYSLDDDGRLVLEFDMTSCRQNDFRYVFTGTGGAIHYRDAKRGWIPGPNQFDIALIGATAEAGSASWQSLAVGCRSPSDDNVAVRSGGDAPPGSRDGSRDDPAVASPRLGHGDRLAPPPRTIADISASLRSDQSLRRDEYAACRAMAARSPPADEERKSLVGFYQARSLAARRLGRLRQYIDDLQTAVALGRVTAVRTDVLGQLLLDLSAAEYEGGNIARAIELRIEGLRTRQQANASAGADWFGSLATLHAVRGEFREAEAAIRKGRELWQRDRQPIVTPGYRDWIEAAWHWAQATIYRTQGRFGLAEAESREGFAAMGRVPPGGSVRLMKNTEWLLDMLHLELSLSLLGQARFAEAEIEARTAFERALRRHGSMSVQTGFMLTNGLIPVLMEEERYEDARELANATIAMYATLGADEDSWVLADVRGHVADSLVYERRWQRALDQFDVIRAGLARDPSTFDRRFGDRVPLNLALIRLGQADRALAQLDASLRRRSADLGDGTYLTAEVRGALAMALAAKGERERAAAEFRSAVPVLVSSLELTDGVATARRRRTVLILEGYVDFLVDESLRATAPAARTEMRAEAFRVADIVRAQGVTRAIAASAARSVANEPGLAALTRREQDLQRQVAGLLQLLGAAAASADGEQSSTSLAQLRRQIDDVRGEHAGVRADLERRHPEYFRLVAPEAPTVAQVRQSLAPGETLLSTYTTDERTYVWAIPREGELRFAVAPIGSAELAQRVAMLRRALDLPATAIGDVPRYDVKAAGALYEALLRPVEGAWRGATTILVVPSEALAQLPPALLPVGPAEGDDASDARYRRVPWLIRKHALAVWPSVASLVSARQGDVSGVDRRREARSFVGFGDPVFRSAAFAAEPPAGNSSGSDAGDAFVPSASGRPGPTVASRRTATLALRAAPETRQASSARLETLPALPDTAEELRSIARTLHADPVRDLHLREDASEATLERLNGSGELSQYRVISFATHGLLPNDLDGLTEPALALTNPAVSGGRGDGLLTMGEVLALRLDADWVVLSACNTAAGEGRGAAAFSGLGRAFFYAGARALLLSNWSVETTSAKALVSDVFERLAANPTLSRAEALRQAMLATLDSGEYRDETGQATSTFAHPIFWAPFTLVGDGRPLAR